MAAFERAVDDGADGIELDLRLTADRQWVVHHDAAIPVGGEPLRIADLSADDVAKLSVGPGRAPIPTLAEFLRWGNRKDLSLTLDIKDKDGTAELIAAIEASGSSSVPVCSTFHRPVLLELKRLRPTWQAVWILGDLRWRLARRLLSGRFLRWAQSQCLSGLHLHERWVTPRLVHAAKRSGLTVGVWTVDDPARISVLALLGIDSIITNRPDVGKRTIDGLSLGSSDAAHS
jgi:glycerophosphoryl diester phosphodiesterase